MLDGVGEAFDVFCGEWSARPLGGLVVSDERLGRGGVECTLKELAVAGEVSRLGCGGQDVVFPVGVAGTTEQPGPPWGLGLWNPNVSVGPTHDAARIRCQVV